MSETSPRDIRWLVVGHGRAVRCPIAAMPALTLLDEIYAGTQATGSFCTNR
jgi:hypothetical protein